MLFYLETNDSFENLTRKGYSIAWRGIEFSYSAYTDVTRCVVRASSETEARHLASQVEPNVNPSVWFKYPQLSTCEPIDPDGNPAIILSDTPTG